MFRAAWILGNWLGQLVWAFRVGYRDGSFLRPGARPSVQTVSENL